jgi:hypothetical protein
LVPLIKSYGRLGTEDIGACIKGTLLLSLKADPEWNPVNTLPGGLSSSSHLPGVDLSDCDDITYRHSQTAGSDNGQPDQYHPSRLHNSTYLSGLVPTLPPSFLPIRGAIFSLFHSAGVHQSPYHSTTY